MQPIKTGLAAFGLSGRVFHAPFLVLHNGFDLTAVIERSKDEARKIYPGIVSVRSFEELLKLDIELVVVNTPDPTHYDYCRAALEAGKHVLVEKPFVFSSAEARELIELADRKKLLLTVYQNRRFDSDFLTVRQVIDSGSLGRVMEFYSAFQRYRPELSPIAWKEESKERVGVTYNLCSHLCDQALALFGRPETVWATMAAQRDGSRTDDYCVMHLAYPDVKVFLRVGTLIREPGPRFAVHGTEGSYVKFGFDPQEEILRGGGGPPTAGDWAREPESAWGILHTGAGREPYPTVTGNYLAFYDNLHDALRLGLAPCVTPDDMIADARMLEAAFESVEEGRAVKL